MRNLVNMRHPLPGVCSSKPLSPSAPPPRAALRPGPSPSAPPPRAALQPEPSPSPSPSPQPDGPAAAPEPETLTFQAAEVKFSRKPEEAGFCEAQLAFLERKSRYALGGPFMPPESVCAVCGGAGKLRCYRCDGGGFNKGSGAEVLGMDTSDDAVLISRNGRVDVNFYLAEGGICVLCRGTGECGCHLCEGSGFAGGITSKFCGD